MMRHSLIISLLMLGSVLIGGSPASFGNYTPQVVTVTDKDAVLLRTALEEAGAQRDENQEIRVGETSCFIEQFGPFQCLLWDRVGDRTVKWTEKGSETEVQLFRRRIHSLVGIMRGQGNCPMIPNGLGTYTLCREIRCESAQDICHIQPR